MIIGLGVDLCNVARLAALRARYGRRFLNRVFTTGEQTRCGEGPVADERYAARFAAKEAFMKAVGTGWSQGLTFRDIEVCNAESGQPQLILTGQAATLLTKLGVTSLHLSLSHERDAAVAFVILEKHPVTE